MRVNHWIEAGIKDFGAKFRYERICEHILEHLKELRFKKVVIRTPKRKKDLKLNTDV